jgi:uncharacterized protein YkwD
VGTGSLTTSCRRVAACAAALAALSLARAHAQDMAAQVLTLVNQQRAANGLPALNRDSALDSAAYQHSNDMATSNTFSHTGSDGSTPGQRINAAGYYWYTCGENIAAGQSSAQAVMDAWMNSSGHRANILSPDFKDIGIAVVYRAGSAYGYYWTQDFGARTGGGTTTSPSAPSLTSLSPTSGPAGTRVTLNGSGFGTSTGSVRFNGTAASIASWSSTQIVATVPSGATTGPVTVRTSAGVTSNGRTFTVTSTSSPPTGTPSLASLSPSSGPRGTTVTISGANLGATQGSSRVYFRYASAFVYGSVSVKSWSNSGVTLQVSPSTSSGYTTGRYYVWIQRSNGDGTYTTTNALVFTVTP